MNGTWTTNADVPSWLATTTTPQMLILRVMCIMRKAKYFSCTRLTIFFKTQAQLFSIIGIRGFNHLKTTTLLQMKEVGALH